MKIQYASDLHLEFSENSKYIKKHPLKTVGDVLILAGDIITWDEDFYDHPFFDYISLKFNHTYYLPGNHEFYKGVDIKMLRKPVCENIRKNVHLVNNVVVNIGEADLFFTPLWTDVAPDKIMLIKRGINDFHNIKYRNQPYTVSDHNIFHKRSIDFLTKTLKASDAKKKIVVTHWVPSRLCNHKLYKNSSINDFFVTELYDFIYHSDIDYWIYGHHHFNAEKIEIGGTTLLTNQLGYVQSEVLKFNRKAYIKL